MGNTISQTNLDRLEITNPADVLDNLATSYILTLDFEGMKRMYKKSYCDKLVILTAGVIDKYFTEANVQFLSNRVKNGAGIQPVGEKVLMISRDNFDKLESSRSSNRVIEKKQLCIEIAKFYVKIGHLFSAILMTVNPTYTYKDPTTGKKVTIPLSNRHLIPSNVSSTLHYTNICENRIHALMQHKRPHNGSLWIRPNICGIRPIDNPKASLLEEPGIPQLRELYFDDKYDIVNGKFKGMSSLAETQLKNDLTSFYKAFTGKKNMPETVHDFNDIPLRDYRYHARCKLGEHYTQVDESDDLFKQYAANISEMVRYTSTTQSDLTNLVSSMFIETIDPIAKKTKIRISPKLTEELLQRAIVKSRQMIVNLYVKCETDYINGIKIFEAIVEKTMAHTHVRQLQSLKQLDHALFKGE